jgi:glycosyltransferase involved in cell wall biosynthesis
MKVLILSTWFPYPLSQGSKIRAYYIIKALAKEHSITLLSFKDNNIEPSWLEHMRQICQRVEVIQQDPFKSNRQNAYLRWLSSKPSSVVASYSPDMASKARSISLEWDPDCVIALTFVTGLYALEAKSRLKIIDVDNFMARMIYESYQKEKSPFVRYRRMLAYRKFLRYERWLYAKFNYSIVVTERDRQGLIDLVHLKEKQVGVVPNGVDTQYNTLLQNTREPDTLIFNGSLTYQNNYDAMDFFLKDIFPLIVKQIPEVQIKITGSTLGVPIESFSSMSRVIFTGYLEDIRPIISESCVCVVPLRMGGGTRLKILEAMALGTPVISTSKGAEGLNIEAGTHLLIADTPQEFAALTIKLLHDRELRRTLAKNAASLVKEKYDWTKIGQTLCKTIDNLPQEIPDYDHYALKSN